MNEMRMLAIVVVSSVLIFLFINLVLGSEENAGDVSATPHLTKSCEPGSVYNEYTGKCKKLVIFNKRLSERIALLMPYFAAHDNAE